jgi:hypothetical protein
MSEPPTGNRLPLDQLPSPREVEAIPYARFCEEIVPRYRPVVIRNFAPEWKIVKVAQNSARDVGHYLKRFDGGSALELLISPSEAGGRLFYDDTHKGVNFKQQACVLSDGIDRMLNRTGGEQYFFQCMPVREFLPHLETELEFPFKEAKARPFIWIGNRITVPPHFDEANNIAVVAAGRRRFTLFPPEQLKNLYVGRLDYTPAGQPISLVDLNDPDLDKFPKYEEAFRHALSATLLPGDAIYIPSPWWHHVESLGPFNVLVNFWWSSAFVSSAMPFPLLIHAILALRNLPREQRQAWKHIVDHYVFELNGDPGRHLPEDAKGILGELTPELTNQLHQWLVKQMR